jgi:hypothetical protein
MRGLASAAAHFFLISTEAYQRLIVRTIDNTKVSIFVDARESGSIPQSRKVERQSTWEQWTDGTQCVATKPRGLPARYAWRSDASYLSLGKSKRRAGLAASTRSMTVASLSNQDAKTFSRLPASILLAEPRCGQSVPQTIRSGASR